MLTTQVSRAQALLCREAVSNGHLQVLDWLLENSFDHERIKGIAVYAATTELGVLTVLDWAKGHGYVSRRTMRPTALLLLAMEIYLPYSGFVRITVLGKLESLIQPARDGGHLDIACRLGDCQRCPEEV
jgi:hypothetical protein